MKKNILLFWCFGIIKPVYSPNSDPVDKMIGDGLKEGFVDKTFLKETFTRRKKFIKDLKDMKKNRVNDDEFIEKFFSTQKADYMKILQDLKEKDENGENDVERLLLYIDLKKTQLLESEIKELKKEKEEEQELTIERLG